MSKMGIDCNCGLIGLDHVTTQWGHINPHKDFGRFTYAVDRVREQIAQDTKDALMLLAASRNPNGFLVIPDVPIGLPPDTPDNSRHSNFKVRFESELSIYAVSQVIGQVFSYAEQSDGEIIHNICPVRGKENFNTGESSTAMLAFHNDGAAHLVPPDFVVLLCLRSGSHPPATLISNINTVIKWLPKDVVALLTEERFIIRDDSELSLQNFKFKKTPIIRIESNLVTNITIDFDYLFPADINDVSAAAALACLRHKIECMATSVKLRARDMLIIDNRVCVHAREPFSAKFDGSDRWLQSAYVKKIFAVNEVHAVKLSPMCTFY